MEINEKILISTEQEADITHVVVGVPGKAFDETGKPVEKVILKEVDKDLFARLDEKSNKVIGFTIKNFKNHFNGKEDALNFVKMTLVFSTAIERGELSATIIDVLKNTWKKYS